MTYKRQNACLIQYLAISWSTCHYGNTAMNKNISYIYVIWFQQKLNWFRFKTKVKDLSFSADAI